MLKKKWIIPLILVLALTITACANNTTPNENNGTDQGTQGNASETNTISNAPYEDIKLTPEEAFNTFKEEYPAAKVDELELDFDDGFYYYKVEGYDDIKEYELKINTSDGTVTKNEKDDKSNSTGEITVEDVRKIEALLDKAISDAGDDYRIKEWVLDTDDSKVIFKIEVVNSNGDDIEYKYDVDTGDLIKKDQ